VTAADRYQTTGANQYWTVITFFICEQCLIYITSAVIVILKTGAVADMFCGEETNTIDGEDNGCAIALQSIPFEHLAYFVIGSTFALWLAAQRNKLREKLGGTTQGKFLMDYICMWCCQFCTIVQEARQVDAIQGVRVQMCCQLIQSGPTGMYMGAASPYGAPVGQAVVIGGQPAPVMGQVVQAQPVVGQVVQAQPVQAAEVDNNVASKV
jgi:hypothetical protein